MSPQHPDAPRPSSATGHRSAPLAAARCTCDLPQRPRYAFKPEAFVFLAQVDTSLGHYDGLTLVPNVTAIAARCGVSRSRLSEIKSGTCDLDANVMAGLVHATGLADEAAVAANLFVLLKPGQCQAHPAEEHGTQ